MKNKTYEGLLCHHAYGEAYGILFLSSVEEPLAEELSWMSGKNVSVRYWVSDKQGTKEEINEDSMKAIMGLANTKFGARYSELTGYLWTDEKIRVGGHDLLLELNGFVGKWLILEIDYD